MKVGYPCQIKDVHTFNCRSKIIASVGYLCQINDIHTQTKHRFSKYSTN